MMLSLGDFKFSINTAAYQSLKQTATYNWATQQTIGGTPVHQNTGVGAETIELEGVIYTHHKGGLSQIQRMQIQAKALKPLQLVSGAGEILGFWVVKHMEQTQQSFMQNGMPTKITFRLQLERYHHDQIHNQATRHVGSDMLSALRHNVTSGKGVTAEPAVGEL